jgi:hypothetical protein
MSGPHLEQTLVKTAMIDTGGVLPVLDIGTASKCMANDHNIVSGFAKRSPGLVSDGYVS